MMAIAAFLVLTFTVVQLAVVSVNLLCREELPDGSEPVAATVSVLIPARNEASRIGLLLSDLIKLDPRPSEIIVCDDHSTDGTAEIVGWFAAHYSFIRCLSSAPLPEGWMGKNFACYQLAREATGDYLLFLDADVRVSRSCVVRAVRFAEEGGVDLVSIFPRQLFTGWGDKIVVPLMNYILLTLLPLVAVRKAAGYASLSAANGQFMLFRAGVYRELQPHRTKRNCRVEDIAIAGYYKKVNRTVACLTGDESIRCCMYSGYRDAVEGFSRSICSFFGDSVWLAFLFWIMTTFGFVFIWFAFSWPVFLVYLLLFVLIRIFTLLVSRQRIIEGLGISLFLPISYGHILWRSVFNKKLTWKGRRV